MLTIKTGNHFTNFCLFISEIPWKHKSTAMGQRGGQSDCLYVISESSYQISSILRTIFRNCTDSVRLTTAFGSDHPVVSRSGRKSNLIYTCMYRVAEKSQDTTWAYKL